jgi:hypothetical protein
MVRAFDNIGQGLKGTFGAHLRAMFEGNQNGARNA